MYEAKAFWHVAPKSLEMELSSVKNAGSLVTVHKLPTTTTFAA